MPSKLSALLVQDRVVSFRQMDAAVQRQQKLGGRVGTNLMELGHVDEGILLYYLSKQRHVAAVENAVLATVDPEVIEVWDEQQARDLQAIPIKLGNGTLRVAVVDPMPAEVVEELERRTGLSIEQGIFLELRYWQALRTFYGAEIPDRFARLVEQYPIPIGTRATTLSPDRSSPGSEAAPTTIPPTFTYEDGQIPGLTWSIPELTAFFQTSSSRDQMLLATLGFVGKFFERRLLFVASRAGLRGFAIQIPGEPERPIERVEIPVGADSPLHRLILGESYFWGDVAEIGIAPVYEQLGISVPVDVTVVPVKVGPRAALLLVADGGESAIDAQFLPVAFLVINRLSAALERLIRKLKLRRSAALPALGSEPGHIGGEPRQATGFSEAVEQQKSDILEALETSGPAPKPGMHTLPTEGWDVPETDPLTSSHVVEAAAAARIAAADAAAQAADTEAAEAAEAEAEAEAPAFAEAQDTTSEEVVEAASAEEEAVAESAEEEAVAESAEEPAATEPAEEPAVAETADAVGETISLYTGDAEEDSEEDAAAGAEEDATSRTTEVLSPVATVPGVLGRVGLVRKTAEEVNTERALARAEAAAARWSAEQVQALDEPGDLVVDDDGGFGEEATAVIVTPQVEAEPTAVDDQPSVGAQALPGLDPRDAISGPPAGTLTGLRHSASGGRDAIAQPRRMIDTSTFRAYVGPDGFQTHARATGELALVGFRRREEESGPLPAVPSGIGRLHPIDLDIRMPGVLQPPMVREPASDEERLFQEGILNSTDDELIDQLIDRDPVLSEASFVELVDRGQRAHDALIARFPGPLLIDRYDPKSVAEPKPIERHGPVVWIVALQQRTIAPRLEPLLASEDANTRYYAARLLAQAAGASVLENMADVLFDSDEQLRETALTFLEKNLRKHADTQNEAMKRIRRRLRTDEAWVCETAITAASRLRDVGAVDDLIEVLDHGSDHTRQKTAQALSQLTLQDFGVSRRKWEHWFKKHGLESRNEWLLDAMIDKEWKVRDNAASELKTRRMVVNYNPDIDKRGRQAARRAVHRTIYGRDGG